MLRHGVKQEHRICRQLFSSEMTSIKLRSSEHSILRKNDSLEVAGNLWNVPTPLRTPRSQWERSFVSGCLYHVTRTEVYRLRIRKLGSLRYSSQQIMLEVLPPWCQCRHIEHNEILIFIILYGSTIHEPSKNYKK